MKKAYFVLALIAIGVLALGLRAYTAYTVPAEVDEDNYLNPGIDLRQDWEDGAGWRALTDIHSNYEHPPLVKILYGLTILDNELETLSPRSKPDMSPPPSLMLARWQAIFAGVLAVLVVARVNLMGGVFLALQSMHVYYTGIAYLDALPVFFTALMGFFYIHAGRHKGYFWLSAVCFGVAVAGKYPYAVVGVGVLLYGLIIERRPIRELIVWGLVSIAAFYILNPYIWLDPVGRLETQLTFHQDYAGRRTGYNPGVPWRQMLLPHEAIKFDQTGLLMPPLVDVVIFVFAVVGGYELLRSRSRMAMFGWWLVVAAVFQMLWRAQWIQHNMILIVPYCVAGGYALESAWYRLRARRADHPPDSSGLPV